jgi:hypothetical protein
LAVELLVFEVSARGSLRASGQNAFPKKPLHSLVPNAVDLFDAPRHVLSITLHRVFSTENHAFFPSRKFIFFPFLLKLTCGL